jgi:carbohydrate kinase (thermoresistant glucokinase family)
MAAQRLAALVVMGVSGAGKTTVAQALAARLGWLMRDGDGFHSEANVAKMSAGLALTDADRGPWLKAIADAIDAMASAGTPVVIACSALKRAYRDVLVHGRPDVLLVYLKGDRALIADRLSHRTDHFMPPALLDSQLATLEEPGVDEPVITVEAGASVDAIVAAVLRQIDRRLQEDA